MDEDATWQEEMSRILVPRMMEILLDEGTLDPSRAKDYGYVRSIIKANYELIPVLDVITSFHHEFGDAARDAARKGQKAAATVLIATQIEHILNHHFEGMLGRAGIVGENEINQALRTNLESKMGWMMKLTGRPLPPDLSAQIASLFALRNRVVHLKIKGVPLGSEHSLFKGTVIEQLQRTPISSFLSLPDQLEAELERITNERWPNAQLAQEIFQAMTPGGSEQARN